MFARRSFIMAVLGLGLGCIICAQIVAVGFRRLCRIPTTTLNDGLTIEVSISKWIIIGPFAIDAKSLSAADWNKDVGLNHDYLTAYGVHEAFVNDADYRTLLRRVMWRRILGLLHGKENSPRIVSWATQRWLVNLEDVLEDPRMVVSYAIANIDVVQQRRVAIAAGSADGMRCWINGQVIISSAVDEIRDLEPYSSVVAVTLHTGSNIIVCKIDRLVKSKDPGWAYSVAITDMQSARKKLQNSLYRPLETSIVRSGGELHPRFDLFEAPTKGELTLRDLEGTIRFQTNYTTNSDSSIRIPNLPLGVYRCILHMGDVHYESDIYVGQLEALNKEISRRTAQTPTMPNADSARIMALCFRVRHLMQPEHYKPQDARWQFKIINAAKDIQESLREINNKQGYPWLQAGYHILTYRSRIDNAIQYYGVHIPERVRPGNKLPVVLNLDGIEETPRPFLEGTRVSDIDDEIERLNAYSTRYGLIIVDPFGRGNSRGAPIQETDIMEVIADIRKRYVFDRERIYLMGMCEGGREAIALAEHFPSIFAAVAADIPDTYSDTPPQISSEEWMRTHDVAQMASNLRYIPVMIQHGDHNDHVPLQHSQDLVDDCRRMSGKCELHILTDSYARYSQSDRIELMIQFLVDKKRGGDATLSSPTSAEKKYGGWKLMGDWFLHDRKETNGPKMPADSLNSKCIDKKTPFTGGPMADIFTGPVLLVVGTGGTSKQQLYAKKIAEEIKNAWRSDFFTTLPEIEDRRLTTERKKDANLIIVGGPIVNMAWKHLANIPVSVTTDGIVVDGHNFGEPNLVIEAVYPNPVNRKRYVMLISTNSQDEWNIRDPQLWFAEGSYDYSVYSATDPLNVMERGIMDACWRRDVERVLQK